ncbi:STYKc [Geosmithia morbida]|uniref:STYKc n=1 Tax=Geosmithia morbida TaxID=1094350 RepID=A0A9P4YY38_9HYPO|nr:STYKc [Geosmithia morbida]KAF4124995.1 STYKc [Geosmithia morbida]
MAELAAETSVPTEEKTEPIPPSEIDMRLSGSARTHDSEHEHGHLIDDELVVPLDYLQLEEHHHSQNIRLLLRPLTKLHNAQTVSTDGDGNCQWLVLRAEVASSKEPEHKVLAVTQTSKDIKFSVRIPGDSIKGAQGPLLWCELYYDPQSDRVVFVNKSHDPIMLERAPPHLSCLDVPPEETRQVNPGLARSLKPGTWRIRVRNTPVYDFRILEKRPIAIHHRSSPPRITGADQSPGNASVKRARSADIDDDKRVKRRISGPDDDAKLDDGAVMFLPDRLVFPLPNGRDGGGEGGEGGRRIRELVPANSHALLDADKDETVAVTGVCELDKYTLTKHEPIAASQQSAVYTASHSKVPDSVITVKVLKTQMANGGDKPYMHERSVIRQADMWLRESQTQDGLEHGSIVKYYGGDARHLSLYMEHVDARDLTAVPLWRLSGWFQGGREDAVRILCDISDALSYLHGRNLVHNDIKPANLLYSPARGAVLCDFGLSTQTARPPLGGGTPYYLPPEFIGQKLRGPPADVWALGVTMLYVLRKIRLPDTRARPNDPRPLYWQIAAIHNANVPHKQYGNGQPAASQMRAWLVEVHDAKEALDTLNPL